MLRSVILAAARSDRVERMVQTAPVSRDVVRRFVAGASALDALRAARTLIDQGLLVSADNLGEETHSAEQAVATRDEYLRLIGDLAEAGLAESVDISVKLTAVGLRFDEGMATDAASAICAAADAAGTTVTVDMEDHTVTDATLEVFSGLRESYPRTGVALQAYLRRTEGDCREFAVDGARVRLCKGAYREPESVAYRSKLDVDKSYVRCLNILMSGPGYPMVATHDPRLIAIAEDRAKWFDRDPGSFEFQLLYGVRPEEQVRLAGEGYPVRVYLPYGTDWYGYLMRRLAERPANVAFFVRALRSRR